MSNPSTAIQPAPQQSKLLEIMASQYQLDGNTLKNVLLKTVFPQDKPVTLEQLASFCAVAHEYKLNPLIREIFAFPSKTGGIIPIVSIDGWITMVQRHPQYNGHKFHYEWKDGKPGSDLLSATVILHRKDREFPIEHTEFLQECKRDTEPWKKWPSRMLTHKCFIQGARYAFGLSGIYDEDEADRILEAERTIDATPRQEIQMPQRQPVAPVTFITGSDAPTFVQTGAVIVNPTPAFDNPADMPGQDIAIDTRQPPDPPPAADLGPNLFEGGVPAAQPTPPAGDSTAKPDAIRRIGKGKAQRLHAIATARKSRTEADFDEFKRAFKIQHLEDLPEIDYQQAEKWAEGA